MKKLFLIGITLFILFTYSSNKEAFAWKPDITHKDFSRYAADESVLSKNKGDYLKNLGFNEGLDKEYIEWTGWKTLSIKDWLLEGAEKEDSATLWDQTFGDARYENHFHNPLKPWTSAGLDDIKTGESSVLWAQDRTEQVSYPTEGDWSWGKIREVYYWALISTTKTLREFNFAQTFKGLGHQMHLIQDAAQPEHARNDTHVVDKNEMGYLIFEAWASKLGMNRTF